MILFKTTSADVYEYLPPVEDHPGIKFAMNNHTEIHAREASIVASKRSDVAYASDPLNPIETVLTSHIVSYWNTEVT